MAHVGDSRAYRLRGNRLEQLTFDHSLIWEMQAAGQLPDDEIRSYIPRNIITRSLGPSPSVQIDLEGPHPIAVGDTFLVCSDGLSGPVDDKEMGIILAAMPPAEAVRALIDLANLRGGPDNITAVVARVTGPPPTAARGAESDAAEHAQARSSVHPLVWTWLGVSTLAAAGAAAVEAWGTAVASLLAAVLASLVALVQRYATPEASPSFESQPLGKGPYRSSYCAPNDEFVDRLGLLVEELRGAATQEDWRVDWPRFRALLDQASAARQAADHAEAVRRYFAAINFVMAQLKLQRALGGEEGTPSE